MGIFLMRIKQFVKDKTALICWIVCAGVMIAVLLQLNLHATERSALPVGLVKVHDGELALRASERFKNNKALYVYEDDFESLYKLLADGYIYCIVEFKSNFDERIKSGETDRIMTMYSAKDNKVATIVGDIASGCCMDAACMYIAYNRYSGLDGSEKTIGNIDEYADLLAQMEQSGEYDYTFEFEYINNGAGIDKEITNGLIYKQVICVLLGMLIMLSVFGCCSTITKEYESGLRRRIRTSSQSAFSIALSEISGIFVCSLPLAFGVLLFRSDQGDVDIFKLLLINIGLIFFSVIVYYLLANILKSVFAYQISGAIILTAFGVCGLVSIFEGVISVNLFRNTPIGFYVRLMCETLV